MLDSNSSSMFVMLATVVGAGIIMVAFFLFGDVVDETTTDVGGMMDDNIGTIEESSVDQYEQGYSELHMMYGGINLARGTEGFLNSGGEDVQEYYTIDQQVLSEMLGEQVTASFKVRNPEGTGGYGRHVLTSDDHGGVFEGTRSDDFPLSEDWEYHTHTFVLTEDIYNALMSVGEGTLEAGIKSNGFVSGNNGDRYPVSVTEYQLELGESATPYRP